MARTACTDPAAFDNGGEKPIKVCGYGLDLRCQVDNEQAFGSAVYPERLSNRLTVREVAMIRVMEALTDKLDWQRKVNDAAIVAKWKAEALEQEPHLSAQAFDWCILELRDKSLYFQRTGLIHALDSENRCVKSDVLLSGEFLADLRQAVRPLLDIDPARKDWHPRSNDQVLNVVHPSLYPLVYGRTNVLPEGSVGVEDCVDACGRGTPFPEQSKPAPPANTWPRSEEHETAEFYSYRFQWLPCDVDFAGDSGTDVRIRSYINNLEPRCNRQLYGLIERAISASIEPWNQVLLRGRFGRVPLRIQCHSVDCEPDDEPQWLRGLLDDEDEDEDSVAYRESLAKVQEYFYLPDDPEMERLEGPCQSVEDAIEEAGGLYGAALMKYRRTRHVIHPEPGDKEAYLRWRPLDESTHGAKAHAKKRQKRDPMADGYYDVNLEQEFRNRGLQVIIKLASIELSPEKPEYAGGSWHVEGMMNEHIVATSIIYYDVDNVTESRISFRHNAELDEVETEHEQDDHSPLCIVFGTDSLREEPRVQELGSIATPQGRLLAFPNTLQHRVEPFELADKSKPGHRRFLVLWLVDPNYRLASTRNVPPQQREWWESALDNPSAGSAIRSRLPAEIKESIMEHVDWFMGLDEAKALRLELMDERTKKEQASESQMGTYNFCEH
ncbi:uncharacterized protein PAN0_004d2474 [Moesziomyces antarcticus]|uniref:Uncharacterized protein n=2 Tax=Pseudozyma antarctica TaxID=84753 RepID=A0A081CC66_PSEA2|nr:uncharacterized protein PAN0_004d2474 [Moesziomyces antarcticus]GAK64262.1 conserved hypothetical protein [Moesziomyces antarcticus]SPO44509.1 uncharacterized protein PSANT_02194 [Moesziomyces antarcticus]